MRSPVRADVEAHGALESGYSPLRESRTSAALVGPRHRAGRRRRGHAVADGPLAARFGTVTSSRWHGQRAELDRDQRRDLVGVAGQVVRRAGRFRRRPRRTPRPTRGTRFTSGRRPTTAAIRASSDRTASPVTSPRIARSTSVGVIRALSTSSSAGRRARRHLRGTVSFACVDDSMRPFFQRRHVLRTPAPVLLQRQHGAAELHSGVAPSSCRCRAPRWTAQQTHPRRGRSL